MRVLFLSVGAVLLALSIFSLITGRIAWTHRNSISATGSVRIRYESTREIPVAPVVSLVALLAGTGLVIAGMRMR